jgi:hypothetical protein
VRDLTLVGMNSASASVAIAIAIATRIATYAGAWMSVVTNAGITATSARKQGGAADKRSTREKLSTVLHVSEACSRVRTLDHAEMIRSTRLHTNKPNSSPASASASAMATHLDACATGASR